MNPPHKRFFTSLKQLEKRLKLDDGNPPPPPPPPPSPLPLPPPQTETQPTDSSSNSPLYILNHHTNTSSTLHTNSIEQPPSEFLSLNTTNPNINPNENPPQSNDPGPNFPEINPIGDIDAMIQMLRLSEFEGKGPETPDVAGDEFYEKIVKVKGPKCKREVERLDGWINYLMSSGGKQKEPFILAHLLLAKAAFISGGGDGGGGDGDGLEFPSTVDEFLQNDPPTGLINLELISGNVCN